MVALCPPRPPRSTTVSARVQPEACFEHEPNNHCVLIEQQVPSVCVCVCVFRHQMQQALPKESSSSGLHQTARDTPGSTTREQCVQG